LKENNNSEYWEEGFDYGLLIKPFGLINIWGVHHIKVISLDNPNLKLKRPPKNKNHLQE
jgi:hypothetical protein